MGNNRRYTTMKKILFLAFALMLSAFTFAQQQLAVLNHNNEITAFYGADAFIDAHSAAVNGDVITLSSGVFNATNITKAITIRGAGAWADSTGGATMLRNNFTIDISQNDTLNLTMEGIYVYNSVTIATVYNPQFIKCYFQWIGRSACHGTLQNASFVNCILAYWYSYYGCGSSTFSVSGTQFLNCVVMESNCYTTNDTYVNCVVRQNPENATSRMFQNCVLYYDYSGTTAPVNNSSTSYNCLYVQLNTDSTKTNNLFSPMASHVLWNKRDMNTVFKTFNGSTEGENFELLPSIANNCLGTDGTQIGIYGGAMPFDPHVTSPLIKRINVANRSTSDGKLEVDIEVTNE
jgi:hypothetical protein